MPLSRSLRARRARARKIADLLARTYPRAGEGPRRDPLRVLVCTILSAQCTDAKVDAVAPSLFEAFPDVHALARAKPREVERIIRPLGLYRNKARHIVAACRELVRAHNGRVPRTMEALTALPGVGRKTANCVFVNAFGEPGLMTDTHFCRVTHRLGLTDKTTPEKIERELAELLPPARWGAFSHQIIRHGRVCCTARKPDCPHCPLRRLCAYAQAQKKA